MQLKTIYIILISALINACAFTEAYREKSNTYPIIKGIGYAIISIQPGVNESEKLVNAIKASKLDAYKELSEQINGKFISNASDSNNRILNDYNKHFSKGIIYGAEVIKSYPLNDDIYVTEIEVDLYRVQKILNTYKKNATIID